MSTLTVITRKFALGIGAAICCFANSSCEFDVPITSEPTGKVSERLLGNWTSKDGKEKMRVRKLDDSIYIVSYNGDLFRAYHSDVGRTPFLSVQDINSAERKYAYLAWKLSADGKTLGLRPVNNKVIPKESRDSATVQKLLEKNLQNPELFEDEEQFTREK
jgi:hypothetical protein